MAARMHNQVHAQMKHRIKTANGRSANYYTGSSTDLLGGTGQGSGASPCIWLLYCVSLLTAFDSFSAGQTVCDPDGMADVIRMLAIYFVDDGSPCVNEDLSQPTTPEPEVLLAQAQQMAQSWERLLFASGGALKHEKCFAFQMFWEWDGGKPTLRSIKDANINARISITPSSPAESRVRPIPPLQRNEVHIGERSLGVRSAPSGQWQTEYKFRKTQSDEYALRLAGATIARGSAYKAYHQVYCPKLEYPLSITGFDMKQCKAIQSKAIMVSLQKMGFASCLPRAVVFGPAEAGGLGFHHLYTEQGIGHIQTFMGNVREPRSRAGKIIRSSLNWCQRLAGTTIPILEDTSRNLDYVEQCWIMVKRKFLVASQLTMEVTKPWVPRPLRINDTCLMEALDELQLGTAKTYRVNSVRLFLQVSHLSEITTVNGWFLRSALLHKPDIDTRPMNRCPSEAWPRQEMPSLTAWAEWRKALRQIFCSDSRTYEIRCHFRPTEWLPASRDYNWDHYFDVCHSRMYKYDSETESVYIYKVSDNRQRHFNDQYFEVGDRGDIPAGAIPVDVATVRGDATQWTVLGKYSNKNQQFQYYTPRNEPPVQSFREYVAHQPEHIRRYLLHCTTEEAKVQQLITHLKAGGKLNGCSDGGLCDHIGTFGWVWTTIEESQAHEKDYHESWMGQGPADGPKESASSTRSELFGTMVSLSYIRLVCEYGDIKIPVQLQLHLRCDNEGCVKSSQPNLFQYYSGTARCCDNYDLISMIHDHIGAIPGSFCSEWVKGHQDKTKSFAELPLEAQLNVIADAGATDELAYMRAQDLEQSEITPHFPAQVVSVSRMDPVTQLSTRIVTKPAKHIRRHIHYPDLSRYWEQRHNWNTDDIEAIDHAGMERFLKRLPKPDHRRAVQLRCGWLPCNKRCSRYMITRTELCSHCNTVPETVDHIFRCPARMEEAVKDVVSEIDAPLKKLETYNGLRIELVRSLTQWIRQGDWAPRLSDHSRYSEDFVVALQEQHSIGWSKAFRGFISDRWRMIQQLYLEEEKHLPEHEAISRSIEWSAQLHLALFTVFQKVWTRRNTREHGDTADPASVLEAQARSAHNAINHFFSPEALVKPQDVTALQDIDQRSLRASPVHEQLLWVDYMKTVTQEVNKREQTLRKADQAAAKILRDQLKAQERLQRQEARRQRQARIPQAVAPS